MHNRKQVSRFNWNLIYEKIQAAKRREQHLQRLHESKRLVVSDFLQQHYPGVVFSVEYVSHQTFIQFPGLPLEKVAAIRVHLSQFLNERIGHE